MIVQCLAQGPAHGKSSDVGHLARLQELEWTRRAAMAWSVVSKLTAVVASFYYSVTRALDQY